MGWRLVEDGLALPASLAGALVAAALAGCSETDLASGQLSDALPWSDAGSEASDVKAAEAQTSTDSDAPDSPAVGCNPACGPGYSCSVSVQPPACVPVACALPASVGMDVRRLTALQLLPQSVGCDLDGDGKPNNRLGKVVQQYGAVNDLLGEQIAAGALNLLVANEGSQAESGALAVSWLVGDLVADQAGCTPAEPASGCSFTVRASSYDSASGAAVCTANSLFTDVQLVGGEILAGNGGNTTLRIPLSITGSTLDLTLRKARLQATTTELDPGGPWTKGRICGAVLPSDGATLLGDAACSSGECDVDVNGDGVLDAMSVAFAFEASKATVVGVTPAP